MIDMKMDTFITLLYLVISILTHKLTERESH